MQQFNCFPKKEHLCGEIRINKLYAEGKAFIAYPYRVVYRVETLQTDVPVLVLVSVPKKRFKKAFKRNKIKRLMREAYRLNKHLLTDICSQNACQVQMALNYVSDSEMDFKTMEIKMIDALKKVSQKIKI